MADDLAARNARARQERFRERLDRSIVDRLQDQAFALQQREAAYRELPPTRVGAASQKLRAQRLEALERSIDWLNNDPRGQRYELPVPRVPRARRTPRYSF